MFISRIKVFLWDLLCLQHIFKKVKHNQEESHACKVLQVEAQLAIILMMQEIAEIRTKQFLLGQPVSEMMMCSGVFGGLAEQWGGDRLGRYSVHSPRNGRFETSRQSKRHSCRIDLLFVFQVKTFFVSQSNNLVSVFSRCLVYCGVKNCL